MRGLRTRVSPVQGCPRVADPVGTHISVLINGGISARNLLTGDMIHLADPDGAGYDEELLATKNAKLNALITDEIG